MKIPTYQQQVIVQGGNVAPLHLPGEMQTPLTIPSKADLYGKEAAFIGSLKFPGRGEAKPSPPDMSDLRLREINRMYDTKNRALDYQQEVSDINSKWSAIDKGVNFVLETTQRVYDAYEKEKAWTAYKEINETMIKTREELLTDPKLQSMSTEQADAYYQEKVQAAWDKSTDGLGDTYKQALEKDLFVSQLKHRSGIKTHYSELQVKKTISAADEAVDVELASYNKDNDSTHINNAVKFINTLETDNLITHKQAEAKREEVLKTAGQIFFDNPATLKQNYIATHNKDGSRRKPDEMPDVYKAMVNEGLAVEANNLITKVETNYEKYKNKQYENNFHNRNVLKESAKDFKVLAHTHPAQAEKQLATFEAQVSANFKPKEAEPIIMEARKQVQIGYMGQKAYYAVKALPPDLAQRQLKQIQTQVTTSEQAAAIKIALNKVNVDKSIWEDDKVAYVQQTTNTPGVLTGTMAMEQVNQANTAAGKAPKYSQEQIQQVELENTQKLVTMQRQLGVPDTQINIFNKQEKVVELASWQLDKGDPEHIVSKMREIEQKGSVYSRYYYQSMGKDLPKGLQRLATVTMKKPVATNQDFYARAVKAAVLKDNVIKSGVLTTDINDMKTIINEEMVDYERTLNLSIQSSNTFEEDKRQMMNYGILLMKENGFDPERAAKEAYNEYLGDMVVLKDKGVSYRKIETINGQTYAYDKDEIESRMNDTVEVINENNIFIPPDTPKRLREQYVENVKDNTFWQMRKIQVDGQVYQAAQLFTRIKGGATPVLTTNKMPVWFLLKDTISYTADKEAIINNRAKPKGPATYLKFDPELLLQPGEKMGATGKNIMNAFQDFNPLYYIYLLHGGKPLDTPFNRAGNMAIDTTIKGVKKAGELGARLFVGGGKKEDVRDYLSIGDQ